MFNPSAAEIFFCYLSLRTDLFFYKHSWTFFFNIYCLERIFSFILMFSGLRIEAPPPSAVQGKCIYTFLKRRTSRFNFRSCVLNLVSSKDNKSFFFQRLVVPESIYCPPVPSKHYQFGRFIGEACQNSRIEWIKLSVKRGYQARFLGQFIDQP